MATKVVRGFCKICHKEIGGMFKPKSWRCTMCRFIFCEDCCPKVGFIFKKPVCPNCGIELKECVIVKKS